MAQTLKFKALPHALVQNVQALDEGSKRFLGWSFKEIEPKVGDKPARHGFVMSQEAFEVLYDAEYVKAAKEGDLLCADAETATICGVAHDAPADKAQPKKGG